MNPYPYIHFLLLFLLMAFQSQAHQLKVNTEQPVIPVLTLKETNPTLKIELIRQHSTPDTIRELILSLRGTTDLNDIESLGLYAAGKNGRFSTQKPLSHPIPPSGKVTFNTSFPLDSDTLIFWVSVKLKDNINLSHRINITCKEIVTHTGKIKVPASSFPGLRTGVALRQGGQDGVNTTRIPGLATSMQGTLLAIYDARYDNSRDLQGNIDICLNRSTDKGRTWQPMQVVLDMKEWGGLPEKYNGVSDACILVDDQTGTIYVAGLWMYGVLDGKTGKWREGLTKDSTRWIHQWLSKGSQPGVGVKQTSQFIVTKSTDDGKTWSEPVNITAQTKREEWWLFAPAPGHGITLKDGTLVFPTQGRDKNGLPFSNITWSKDKGKTWTTSNPAYNNVTECMAVELPDGSIMLNMRDNRNGGNQAENGRRICTTTDLGQTWTEHPTSRKALIEPTCMGSLHKHDYTRNGKEKSLLLFSNPDSWNSRDHITLKVSFDNGNTWKAEKQILLDEYGGFGYSCITSVDEETIGIVYEGSQAQLTYQQIKLSELIH